MKKKKKQQEEATSSAEEPASEKKGKKEKQKKPARFIDFVAFFGLMISALLLVVGPILRKWNLQLANGLGLIAQYSMLLAIALPAYAFVRNKGLGWKVFYLVCLLIYFTGTILGLTLA